MYFKVHIYSNYFPVFALQLECGHEILDEVVKKIYQVERSLSHYHSYLSHLKLYEVSSCCDYRRQDAMNLEDTKRKRYVYIFLQIIQSENLGVTRGIKYPMKAY